METAAPFDAAAPVLKRFERLELARNLIERGREAVTDVAHSGNRGNGDESGNQAILNRGRTGLVVCETSNNIHSRLLAHVICFAQFIRRLAHRIGRKT